MVLISANLTTIEAVFAHELYVSFCYFLLYILVCALMKFTTVVCLLLFMKPKHPTPFSISIIHSKRSLKTKVHGVISYMKIPHSHRHMMHVKQKYIWTK